MLLWFLEHQLEFIRKVKLAEMTELVLSAFKCRFKV